jgi:hypothetical protein
MTSLAVFTNLLIDFEVQLLPNAMALIKYTLVVVGALASTVLGHGQVQNFTVNGVYNQGFIRTLSFPTVFQQPWNSDS